MVDVELTGQRHTQSDLSHKDLGRSCTLQLRDGF